MMPFAFKILFYGFSALFGVLTLVVWKTVADAPFSNDELGEAAKGPPKPEEMVHALVAMFLPPFVCWFFYFVATSL